MGFDLDLGHVLILISRQRRHVASSPPEVSWPFLSFCVFLKSSHILKFFMHVFTPAGFCCEEPELVQVLVVRYGCSGQAHLGGTPEPDQDMSGGHIWTNCSDSRSFPGQLQSLC